MEAWARPLPSGKAYKNSEHVLTWFLGSVGEHVLTVSYFPETGFCSVGEHVLTWRR